MSELPHPASVLVERLILISLVLLLRAATYFIPSIWGPEQSHSFRLWSSLIVLALGLCFAVGTWKAWPALSLKEVP